MTKASKKFISVLEFAFLGIVAGLVLGFAFGSLIGFLGSLVAHENEVRGLGSFLGMGVGSTMGALFGGIVGYKDGE
ncbi:hypothetical protein KJ632_02020 [Patescibacteria group bacterium]|nr:hypothetical protein [Patescibacteria group bacterium]